MLRLPAAVLMLVFPALAHAELVTQAVPYQDGRVALEGYLAYDDQLPTPRPGVLVVPEWWGLNDFARQKARALAELGYVAFAVDLYGKGVVTDDPNEARRLAEQLRSHEPTWRARAKAGYDALAANARVDCQRIAAIGFCLGGSTVLKMAADLPLAGVVSFHGGLSPLDPRDAAAVTAKILILHGAADTLVSPEALRRFEESLVKCGVDWQFITYGGAKHSFTNPAADKLGMDGVGYDASAARRSWQHMQTFLTEAFGPPLERPTK